MEPRELLSGIEAAARHAGQIMLEARNIDDATHVKGGHGNFVTDFDQRVQETLFAELGKLLPQARFVGEEAGADVFTDEDREGYAFCIDPIDGTLNFIHAYRPSTTSIGLLKDGKTYMGVVYNPYEDMLFSAMRGDQRFVFGQDFRSAAADHAKPENGNLNHKNILSMLCFNFENSITQTSAFCKKALEKKQKTW